MATIKKSILSAIIAAFVLGGTFLFLYHQNSVKSQEIAQYEQNWKAAMDTVEYYKLKNGELLAERASFVPSETEMRQQLDMSKEELKDIKKKLGSAVAQLSKVQTEVRIDSIYIESEPEYVATDTISAPFQYSDDWLALAGRFNYGSGHCRTALDNISMDVPLTIGMTENKQYFVSTSNPYVHVTDIVSTINEKSVPKKKHWGVGVTIGPSFGYDLRTKNIYYGIGGTIGINYSF